MKIELDDPGRLRAHLAQAGHLRDVVVQGLDLAPFETELARAEWRGSVLLGCVLPPAVAARAAADGALVFPRLPGRPYEPFRRSLYSPEELYAGFDPERPESYRETLDARTYASYVDPATRRERPCGLDEVLARRLHDFSVADALGDFLGSHGGAGVVAVMGGHDRRRDDPAYADIARLARTLRRDGYLVATGGGPGLMEAANLGAWLAPWPDDVLDRVLEALAQAPAYTDARWLAQAFRARAEILRAGHAAPGASLGVPTWLYGHEPPNVFATHLAKYFENSVREEGLLALATHGVVFAPGNAGTVQEVFQDACQNYYRTHTGFASPMVLFGVDYWNPPGPVASAADRRKPVYPLLRKLAEEKGFGHLVLLSDSVEEIAAFIRSYRPPA